MLRICWSERAITIFYPKWSLWIPEIYVTIDNLIKKFGLIENYVSQMAGLKDVFQLLKNFHLKAQNVFA